MDCQISVDFELQISSLWMIRNCSLGANTVLLTMWGANAAAPLLTVHLGYGLGAVIVNLLVGSFLTETVSTIDSTEAPNTVTETRANLFIPYTVTAVCCTLIALGHIFFHIRGLTTRKETLEVREVWRSFEQNS